MKADEKEIIRTRYNSIPHLAQGTKNLFWTKRTCTGIYEGCSQITETYNKRTFRSYYDEEIIDVKIITTRVMTAR